MMDNDQLQEILQRLTRIEGKLDHDYNALHGTEAEPGLLPTVRGLDRRVSRLETIADQKREHWANIAVVIAFLIQAAISLCNLLKG